MPRTPPSVSTPDADTVEAVRRFNRFYTRRIGVLGDGVLGSPFSLTEARVLFELNQREQTTATDLGRDLGLDPGYLSRILRRFERLALIARARSATDRRQSLITLRPAGRRAFGKLDAQSRREVAALLAEMSAGGQGRVLAAMDTIEGAIGSQRAQAADESLIRAPRPGDFGWVIERHGSLYASEYGWDSSFETLVARIVTDYLESHDDARERCWIAERAGERVGCVFLVRKSERVAKLRLLLVDPAARGLGLGHRLVAECIDFARACGYRSMTLWTNAILDAARHTYEAAGFVRTHTESRRAFGHDLVFETWNLALGDPPRGRAARRGTSGWSRPR